MPIHAVVTTWQDPLHRFMEGRGELTVGVNGPVFTLWEALISFDDSQFPILVGDKSLSKAELLGKAWDISLADPSLSLALPHVAKEGVEKIGQMFRQAGLRL